MSKPNKFLYYTVLAGSFLLSAAALFVAYSMVMGSYQRSLDRNGGPLQAEYYTNKDIGNMWDGQSAQEWLGEVLISASAKSTDDMASIRGFKLSQSFTKMGWWDYESFTKFYRSENVSFAEPSAFQVEDLGKNKAGVYSWIISLPVTITDEENSIEGVLKVSIEQESFNGQKKDMKIVSWQMM